MGYKASFVEFKESLPEAEEISRVAKESAEVEVECSTAGYGKYYFLFKPKNNKEVCVNIECQFYHRQNKIKVDYDDFESLNKYPDFFHFAIVSAMVSLGGISRAALPFYSSFSWNNWVKLNGRASPTIWNWKVLTHQGLVILLLIILGIPALIVSFVLLFCSRVFDWLFDEEQSPTAYIL